MQYPILSILDILIEYPILSIFEILIQCSILFIFDNPIEGKCSSFFNGMRKQ